MKTLLAYRHTALMVAIAAFLLVAQPIIASIAFGLIFGACAPIMAMLEWMQADEAKRGI
jgi:hypothetical protein